MKKENNQNIEETTEIMEVSEPISTQLTELTDDSGELAFFGATQKAAFSSLNPQTQEEKIAFYNSINSPSKKLGDVINMEIEIKHVYAEECDYRNKETGELTAGVRIVLIDDKGNSYNTSSIGVFNCLTKIFKIFGHPATWEKPIKARVKQISPSDAKRVLLLELV